MATPWLNDSGHFLFWLQKLNKRPEAKVGPHRPLRSSTKYLTRNPKYS